MHIRDIFKNNRTSLSFEFFPPKSPAASENLFNAIAELQNLAPAYVSVTYGAGGTTRELTHDLVVRIQREIAIPVVSHLTCVGSTKDEILAILNRYSEKGIQNIMALRGDAPKGSLNWQATEGGFTYAKELVAFIKEQHPQMGIGVAGFPEGHPECPNRLIEMDHLKAKVDAGADYICTQLFFDNRDFYDFCERCELAGITVPIVAGIMPVTSMANLQRMAELSAGSRFPAKLLRTVGRASSDEDIQNIGIHWAAEQVNDLLNNRVAGIHFYTLNKSEQTLAICKAIGISHSSQCSNN